MNCDSEGASPRLPYSSIAFGLVLSLLMACSHRDPPKCFSEAQDKLGHTAVETSAIADARRREGAWCETQNTQCGFFVSTLESGEVMVRVEHASAQDEASTRCSKAVDSDTHYLYSATGKLEEWRRGAGSAHRS